MIPCPFCRRMTCACINAAPPFIPHVPAPVPEPEIIAIDWTKLTYPNQRLSDADVDRIAKRALELLKADEDFARRARELSRDDGVSHDEGEG